MEDPSVKRRKFDYFTSSLAKVIYAGQRGQYPLSVPSSQDKGYGHGKANRASTSPTTTEPRKSVTATSRELELNAGRLEGSVKSDR